jgi:2-dehydropantoate 2-reductase
VFTQLTAEKFQADEMNDAPILLVGTGAMASLFAALLSSKGLKVRMFGSWSQNIKALNEKGLRFIDQDKSEVIFPVEATDNPENCAGSRLAIVLVKSYQTSTAAKLLASCLAEDGIAITLQNGLGNYELLAKALGNQRVISGVTTLGATLIGPGIVRMGGSGGITIGDHERVEMPAEILKQAGFAVEIIPDTSSLVWGKLVINASINPLTALLDIRNGDLLENRFALDLMELIAVESSEVAHGIGIRLPYDDPFEMVVSVARKTAENYSSMNIDIKRGGQTEIDAINGAIVRVGDAIGAPTNFNRMLWKLVKARTEK